MKTRTYLIVSSLIFLFVALMHLMRLAQGWPAEVGTMSIPLWASGLGLLVSGGVAVWGLNLARRT